MKRYALVSLARDDAEQVARYLPQNYKVLGVVEVDEAEYEKWKGFDKRIWRGKYALVQGEDVAGWTMDDYVLPRLGSGLMAGYEIDLSHPIMRKLDLRVATGQKEPELP